MPVCTKIISSWVRKVLVLIGTYVSVHCPRILAFWHLVFPWCSPPSECVLNTCVVLCIILKMIFFYCGKVFLSFIFTKMCFFFRNVSCAVFCRCSLLYSWVVLSHSMSGAGLSA